MNIIMKIKLLPFFTIILLLSFSSCSKKMTCPDSQKAPLVDRTGLDGCSFMIELKDGTMLEPRNLTDFTIEKKDGLKVWISYHNAENGVSICMAGKMIEIDCIEER